VTLNAFDVRPTCDTSHQTCLRGFGGNGSFAWTSAVSHVGRTSNAFKVTTKLETFLFEMVVTSCISVQYVWKYGFAKSSDNLYASCVIRWTRQWSEQQNTSEIFRVKNDCYTIVVLCAVNRNKRFPGPTHELDHELDKIKISKSETNINNNKILNENEKGWACGKHGREEKCV